VCVVCVGAFVRVLVCVCVCVRVYLCVCGRGWLCEDEEAYEEISKPGARSPKP
jgi:hypothetical protein